MLRRFLSALILLPIIGLLAYTVLLNPGAKASPKELSVLTRTQGHELLKAEVLDHQVSFTLKNNHKQTITAFSISFGDSFRITEDFAYSEVHKGIAPDDTFEKSYQLSDSDIASGLPILYLQAVLFESGSEEGDALVAQRIKDERLGEKIQFHRALKILENQAKLPKNLKGLKDDIDAGLDTSDAETLITLNGLRPGDPLSKRSKLSDELRQGLQVGREKMLQKVAALEQVPNDRREAALTELKARSSNLLTKL